MDNQPERRPNGGSHHADRRLRPRLQDGPPLHVAGLRATVHDVSRTGIALRVQERIPPGQRVLLVLTDIMDGSRQEIQAEAVWSTGDRAGFQWVDLTPQQDRWLLQRFQIWLAAAEGNSRR